jgi:hypothetical protein
MKRTFGILLVVFTLLAAFSLVSFRLMSSRMARDATVAASDPSASNSTDVQPGPEITLRVEGGSRLALPVQRALAGALQKDPLTGAIQLASSSTDTPESAVLNVSLDEQGYFWSPFYARARVAVEVAYASNGDISFRQEDPPHFRSSGDRPATQMLGHYAFADVSWGLISKPGYRDYLAEQIASAIVAGMQEQLKVKRS